MLVKIINLKLTVLVILAAVLAPVLLNGNNAVHAQPVTQNQTKTTSQQPLERAYSYTAQPGDSYTLLARKAVQTYGLTNEVDIGQDGVIFAETNLTLEARSPELLVGQPINIQESAVKQWVEKAKNLTVAEKAAWGYYIQFVNFDTSQVGETK